MSTKYRIYILFRGFSRGPKIVQHLGGEELYPWKSRPK